MVKIKLGVALPLIVILGIAAVSYIFLVPRNSFRNDCGKSLAGYDALFVYKQGCPVCKADLSELNALNLTEKFYMIDGESLSCSKIINEYSDYIVSHKNSNMPSSTQFLIPVNVCLRDNKTYVGGMNETELKSFYENCTGVELG